MAGRRERAVASPLGEGARRRAKGAARMTRRVRARHGGCDARESAPHAVTAAARPPTSMAREATRSRAIDKDDGIVVVRARARSASHTCVSRSTLHSSPAPQPVPVTVAHLEEQVTRHLRIASSIHNRE